MLIVGGQLAVEDIGEPAFEAAQGFHRCLAGGEFASVVGASLGVVADLDDGHDVQDPVDNAAYQLRRIGRRSARKRIAAVIHVRGMGVLQALATVRTTMHNVSVMVVLPSALVADFVGQRRVVVRSPHDSGPIGLRALTSTEPGHPHIVTLCGTTRFTRRETRAHGSPLCQVLVGSGVKVAVVSPGCGWSEGSMSGVRSAALESESFPGALPGSPPVCPADHGPSAGRRRWTDGV